MDHTYKAPLANAKMECPRCPEKPLILGRSGIQYVAMVTKLLRPYCGDTAKIQTFLIQTG